MNRSEFLKRFGVLGLGMAGVSVLARTFSALPLGDKRMPALFVGHGHPANVLADNSYTQALAAMAVSLPVPTAVLVVSAHWLTRGSYVTGAKRPVIIHDFWNVADDLYDLEYPVAGSPAGAKLAVDMLRMADGMADMRRGLDHGAWGVLRHMYPKADVPVFQLSIDRGRPPVEMYQVAKMITGLRDKGVLIIGSGSITHNPGEFAEMEDAPIVEWAEEFDAKVANLLLRNDHKGIVGYQSWGKIAKHAHPSDDHFLPLIYSIGVQGEEEEVSFFHEGFQYGSISMRCVKFG
ncbi:MAG TPA: 4,5-DOPA dioxygenase extradiol [Bacteroidetes bacterium]|nr:4,5-DOPA dioxygenase extradiol [Bacteroidota bacterium]